LNDRRKPAGAGSDGLGIRFVGERTAELLAQEFGTIDAVIAANSEELERVEEVGPRISEALLEFLARKESELVNICAPPEST